MSEFEFVAEPSLHAIRIAGAKVTTHVHVARLQERRQLRVVNAFFAVIDEILKARERSGVAAPGVGGYNSSEGSATYLSDFRQAFHIGSLAQLVEQRTLNPLVVGSIPTRPTNPSKGLA